MAACYVQFLNHWHYYGNWQDTCLISLKRAQRQMAQYIKAYAEQAWQPELGSLEGLVGETIEVVAI